jgi:hypothetical protein
MLKIQKKTPYTFASVWGFKVTGEGNYRPNEYLRERSLCVTLPGTTEPKVVNLPSIIALFIRKCKANKC